MGVVCINICYGDVTSAEVDPYVIEYPRMMVMTPDRGKLGVYEMCIVCHHSRRLRVASGATAPGPALEGVPHFRPVFVLMSLSIYVLR
jgi:hypothetical protein